MPRKTTAALIAALGINFALAGGALLLANMNKPIAYDADTALMDHYSGDLASVAGVAVDAEAGDLAIPLKAAQQGGNTRVTFKCGKLIPGGREDHEGTWDAIGGAVLYRPEGQVLKAVEAVFDTRSLRTDAQALTQTVTVGEKWFDIDNHPTATFRCDTIQPVDAATPSYTHDLIGSFTLNGITNPITIPATLAFAGQALTIDASFVILRSDFEVSKRASSLAGTVGGVVSEVDDEVHMTVRVTAAPDPTAVIGELAQTLEQQQEALRQVREQLAEARTGIAYFAAEAGRLEKRIDMIKFAPAAAEPADLSDIPLGYTDALPTNTGPVPFSMVLVPGEGAVEPFYISKHEVTWRMVTDWVYCADLEADDAAQKIAAGVRPSPLWGTLAEQFQVSDKAHPAMGMTRLTAEAFCQWLSEKTGRRYRLPTVDEWMHALEMGGGIPEDLDAYAWHEGNAPKHKHTDEPITSPIGTRKPNTLGVHDMLGGVAEWVTGTGKPHAAVGGSIHTAPAEITPDWRTVEDIWVWSASYPNFPKSRFWYADVYHTGIRLVCEPASVAANPPGQLDEGE